MISSGANNIIGRCRHVRKAGLPLYAARCSSSSTDPKPYPAVTIRGTPLPKLVGDHSWAQVELAKMGEKMQKGAWIERMKAHGGQRLITADVYKECPDGIRDLVDELLTLSRFEVHVIMKKMQERLGITEAMKRKAKLMPYAMPTGEPSPDDPSVLAAAAVAKAGTAAAKDSYDLMLKSYDTTAKIKMIKEVRSVTGLGLKEAKEIVDKSPGIIKKGLTKQEAEDVVKAFAAAGGVVELV